MLPQPVHITIGEGSVAIRRANRSRPVVADILGIDRDAEGAPVRIWLDRLVHAPEEQWSGDWGVGGAVSSYLVRIRRA
jgi:hypothetical protein